MTTGVKPSPTQVYNPDHDVNLPFKGGRVNPDSVSKVVDENGEPLVVYHGTTENFTEFAGRQSWKAQFKEDIGTSYFTSDKEMAEGYANGKNPIAVFLSLKNPYQYNADGMSYFGANYNSLTKAREDDHDGVIITNVEDTSAGQEERLIDTYITFSPNQIKSATGNNGNFDPNDANIYNQSAPVEGANVITGDLDRVNPDVKDAVESRIARMDEEEQQRVRANLEAFKSTSWAAAAIKGMAYREMLERALVGEDISNLERNAIWGKQDMSATKLIKAFKKHPNLGPRVLKQLLSSYDFIGGNRKAENDVSTSFTNCDPSEACAVHCYAANSNARPSEIAKSEFTEFMIEHFPQEMANKIAGDYLTTEAGKSGLSLRLNDKGDLSPAQVHLIKLINDKGVAVQVFSKRPELLRELSDINLKCLASTILSGSRQLPWPVFVEKWATFLNSVFFDNCLLRFQ